MKKIGKLINKLFFVTLLFYPYLAFAADADPISKAGKHIYTTLFGGLGISLSSIIIGVTFLLAKVGKVSWDRFVFIGLCSAGFLGTPSLIALIQSWVK